MSLLLSAAPLSVYDSPPITRSAAAPAPRRGAPARTAKRRPDAAREGFASPAEAPAPAGDAARAQEARAMRVNELIGQMSALSQDDDARALADFRPIDNPEPPSMRPSREAEEWELEHAYGPPAAPPVFRAGGGASDFAPDSGAAAELSGYRQSYEAPPIIDDAHYHVRRGAGGADWRADARGDARLMEKINYMVHMMEEQRHERTDHVAEEFVLYTFLGVFVIFAIDSFSRIGKYTR